MAIFSKKAEQKYIFDVHMHLITLKDICLTSYFSFIEKNKLAESLVAFSASDYIYKDLFSNFSKTISLFSVMEQSIVDSISLLDKDLSGFFEKKNVTPIIDKNGIELAGHHFDKLVLSPLIMDFDYSIVHGKSHYNIVPSHKVVDQADGILKSFHDFAVKNPKSKFIFRPFLGINPFFWEIEAIEIFLHTYFSQWSPIATEQIATWEKTKKHFSKKKYNNAFAGIKLYPPMNCDPYPYEKKEREKMDLIYSFCEKKTIPIITHCDNQGFRIIDFDKAQLFTSPDRWKKVLEKYPHLYVDFAHFGKQYVFNIPFLQQNMWQDKIIELIVRYPNVYTDTSFNGVEKTYWDSLSQTIENQPSYAQEILRSKIMFGTDWPLSLSKIQSATAYWNNFKHSTLDDDLKIAFASINPSLFYFRKT
ncbi:MAG: amidohydrolase family protein [Treponemataceae bacterium]